jgi:hypothetical protein
MHLVSRTVALRADPTTSGSSTRTDLRMAGVGVIVKEDRAATANVAVAARPSGRALAVRLPVLRQAVV